jgi:hypothetical protein
MWLSAVRGRWTRRDRQRYRWRNTFAAEGANRRASVAFHQQRNLPEDQHERSDSAASSRPRPTSFLLSSFRPRTCPCRQPLYVDAGKVFAVAKGCSESRVRTKSRFTSDGRDVQSKRCRERCWEGVEVEDVSRARDGGGCCRNLEG